MVERKEEYNKNTRNPLIKRTFQISMHLSLTVLSDIIFTTSPERHNGIDWKILCKYNEKYKNNLFITIENIKKFFFLQTNYPYLIKVI